jgi:hypothetical protein
LASAGPSFLFCGESAFLQGFGKKRVFDVVILRFGCGELCGESGLPDVGFWLVDFLQG